MKNKKALYILLPVVILVWGVIAFKIIGHLNKSESGQVVINTNEEIVEENITPDTFSLIADYRDPFLNRTIQVKNKPTGKIKRTNKPNNKRIVWPEIIYSGRMVNQTTNKSIVSLTINGSEKILNVGQTIDNVTLIKAYSDSIKVKYEREFKTINKQQ